MITGNSSSIVEAYLERRPWVIMLGDSTVRTMYHKLLGLLTAPHLWGEFMWPVMNPHSTRPSRRPKWGGVPNGHGPNGTCTGHGDASALTQWQPPEVWSNRTDVRPCVQEAFVHGVRLTSAWSAWGELREVQPLLSAAGAGRHGPWQLVGAPSVVLVSIGAWLSLSDNLASMLTWSNSNRTRIAHECSINEHNRRNAYQQRITQLMKAIEDAWSSDGRDEYGTHLPGLWQAPQLVWASITICKGAPAKTLARVAQVNAWARTTVSANSRWSYFDRSSRVIDGACDCPANDAFHPLRQPLNVMLELLALEGLPGGGSSGAAGANALTSTTAQYTAVPV